MSDVDVLGVVVTRAVSADGGVGDSDTSVEDVVSFVDDTLVEGVIPSEGGRFEDTLIVLEVTVLDEVEDGVLKRLH